MYFQMVWIEQRKLFHGRLFWIELGLLTLAVGLMFGGIYFAKSQFEAGNANNGEGLVIEADSTQEIENQLLWPAGISNTFAITSRLSAFLLIILAGTLVAQEYTWRTISVWLSRGVPRPLFVLAKLSTILLATFCLVGTAVFVGILISSGFSLRIAGTLPFSDINWGMIGLNILTISFSLLPYAVISFFIAIATRSAIASIGVGLAYITLIEPLMLQLLPLLGQQWETAVQFLPGGMSRLFNFLLPQINANAAPAVIPDGTLSMETAVFVILLYILVFAGSGLLIFQRQDLGG
ncbi:MAG: ABC transporter permease subunit [Chloroflexota bacterium]